MERTFFEESTAVADRYIRTITFIDDEATFDENSISDHVIDANIVTKKFAELGKSCTFFKMQTIDEQEAIIELTKNSDVCVLDWRLTLPSPDGDQISAGSEEDDITDAEGRGKHAKQLLRNILNDMRNSPKLVIIYTAERDTVPIYNSIKELLPTDTFSDSDETELWFQSAYCRVSIYLKPPLSESHHDDISNKSIPYSELPTLISEEFAKLTGGLISNVALSSISDLRENSNRLLQLYNKELDPAFLAHRGMLPIPEDAEELLKDSLVGSVNSIFSYERISQNCNYERIEKWIEQAETFIKDEIEIKKKKLSFDKEARKLWQRNGFKSAVAKLLEKNQEGQISEKKIEAKEKNIHKYVIDYYTPKERSSEGINEEFAILTHHKSNLLQPNYTPQLTLGVIIRETYSEEYLLCIQQRCDSVRIEEDYRRFLFLPLEKTEKNFGIIYKDKSDKYVKLKVKNKNCFDLKTINFKQTGNGIVSARNENKKPIFKDAEGKKLEWVLDLKEAHAQKIVNEFSANLSRVGLDESEWLRRS